MGRSAGEHLREDGWENAVRRVPGHVERLDARLRARHYPHVPLFRQVSVADKHTAPLKFIPVGLGIAPWNVVGGGRLRTDEEEEHRRQTGEKGRSMMGMHWERNEDEKKMSRALEKIAKEVGTQHITAVAIAYVMQKTTHVFPIVGGRKVEHLMANIEALSIALSEEQIKELEAVIPFSPGFPNNFFVGRCLARLLI